MNPKKLVIKEKGHQIFTNEFLYLSLSSTSNCSFTLIPTFAQRNIIDLNTHMPQPRSSTRPRSTQKSIPIDTPLPRRKVGGLVGYNMKAVGQTEVHLFLAKQSISLQPTIVLLPYVTFLFLF